MNEREKHSPRRRQKALIVAIIAMGAILLFLLWLQRDAGRDRLESSPATPAQSVPAPTGTVDATAALQALPAPIRESNRDGMLEKVAALLKGPRVEVCGLSDLEAALFLVTNGHEDMTAANAAMTMASGKLIQSDRLREKVLGLYAQSHLAESAAYDDAVALRCKAGDVDCRIRTERQPQLRSAAAEPLVRLALAGRDPATYAAAIYACGFVRTGACTSVSYAGWAKIDPDNAMAWLLAAGEAAERKDPIAEAESLQRAATAKGYDARIPILAPLFESDAVKTQSPLVRSSIALSLWGTSSLPLIAPAMALGTYCVRPKTLDAERQAICEKLANKMLEKDESLVGLAMATAVGKKLAWDAARLQALHDERMAIEGVMADALDGENIHGCEVLAKNIRWIQNALSKGELATNRDLMAKSGKTIPELAEKYRTVPQGSSK